MNIMPISGQRPNTAAKVMMVSAGLILVGESFYFCLEAYIRFVWDRLIYSSIHLSGSTLTDVSYGAILMAAAFLCFRSPEIVMAKGVIPAVLLMPYGMWLVVIAARVWNRVYGELSTHVAFGFLSGLGFIVLPLLILAAIRSDKKRRANRLKNLYG